MYLTASATFRVESNSKTKKELEMNGSIKDFFVSDNLGRRFCFCTDKSPSGAPIASTFVNAAGHLNKGYVWHFSLEEKPGKRSNFETAICLSHRASRQNILSAFCLQNASSGDQDKQRLLRLYVARQKKSKVPESAPI